MAFSTETYVRVMTSEGRGAIAVVRVWGLRAVELVDRVFQPARSGSLANTAPGYLRLGRAGVGVGDEVVAVRLEGSVPIVEIQCHGGIAAVRSVVAALEAAGACRTSEGDGGMDQGRIALQAMADLPHAPTLKTAEILLEQAQGALDRELVELSRDLRNGILPASLTRINTLISRGAIGQKLLVGWKVAITGRPNVGKSRLLNALVGFTRAIVDPTPGVTRDVVTFLTAFAGWPVELADTAGIRETEDAIERLGIERSRREQRDADLVLLILDGSEPLQAIDFELIASNPGALLVVNKTDLSAAWDTETAFGGGTVVSRISAEYGGGLEALMDAIVGRLVPNSPAPGAAVPFRHEHMTALREARGALLAENVELAISRLDTITGPSLL